MISSIKHCWDKKLGSYLIFIYLSIVQKTSVHPISKSWIERLLCSFFTHRPKKKSIKLKNAELKNTCTAWLFRLYMRALPLCSRPGTVCSVTLQEGSPEQSRGSLKCPMSWGRPQTVPSLYRMKGALVVFSLIIYPILCWVSLVYEQ